MVTVDSETFLMLRWKDAQWTRSIKEVIGAHCPQYFTFTAHCGVFIGYPGSSWTVRHLGPANLMISFTSTPYRAQIMMFTAIVNRFTSTFTTKTTSCLSQDLLNVNLLPTTSLPPHIFKWNTWTHFYCYLQLFQRNDPTEIFLYKIIQMIPSPYLNKKASNFQFNTLISFYRQTCYKLLPSEWILQRQHTTVPSHY